MGKYDDVIGSINSTASAGGIIGGLISSIGAGRRQWKWYQKQSALNYEYQQKAAEAEFNRQKEMWRLNNEYNSPSAQRKRLEEANMLGPALFDGSGPTEASMPSVSTPGSSAPGGMLSPMPGADNMARYVGIARQIAEINNINASTRRTDQQAITEQTQQQLNIALSGLTTENKIVASYKGEALNLQNRITEATMNYTIQSGRLAFESACLTLLEQKKRIELMSKKGLLSDQELKLAQQAFWMNVSEAVFLELRNEATRKGIELSEQDIKLMKELVSSEDIRNNILGYSEKVAAREWRDFYGGDDATNQFSNGSFVDDEQRTPYGYSLAQIKRDFSWTGVKEVSGSVGAVAGGLLGALIGMKRGRPSSGSGLYVPSSSRISQPVI